MHEEDGPPREESYALLYEQKGRQEDGDEAFCTPRIPGSHIGFADVRNFGFEGAKGQSLVLPVRQGVQPAPR